MGHAAICCCSLTSICPGWRLRFRRWFYRSNPLHGRLNVASKFISLMSCDSLLWRLINLDSAADFSSTLTLLSLGFAMTLRCFQCTVRSVFSKGKKLSFFCCFACFYPPRSTCSPLLLFPSPVLPTIWSLCGQTVVLSPAFRFALQVAHSHQRSNTLCFVFTDPKKILRSSVFIAFS